MKKKFKVSVLCLAMFFLFATFFSSCGGGDSSSATTTGADTSVAASQGTTVGDKNASNTAEPITFDFFVNVSWQKWPEWGTDEVSKMVMEKTGVKLNFIMPNTDDNQQMNLMIASGELPDYVFNEIPNPTFKTAIAANIYEDLMPLMEQYAPEMKSNLGDDYWKLNASADGKNYFFANAEIRPSNMNRFLPVGSWNPAVFYREDIYKELGSPKIDTPDELFNVLKTVKEKYKDVTPILFQAGTKYDFTGQPYGFNLALAQFGVEKYYDKDNKLYASYKDPNYLEGMKWINKLYNAGIIKRTDLVLTDEQSKAIKEGGKCFYLSGAEILNGYYTPPANQNVKYIYAPMFPNAKVLQQASLGWGGWFITKKCKDKERAIEFMSYMVSDEGEKLTNFGVEGKNWKMDNGKPDWTDEEYAALKADPDRINKTGINLYWFNLDLYDHWIATTSMLKNPETKVAYDLYMPHKDLKMYLLVSPPDSDKEEATILQKVLTKYNEAFPAMIMAKSPEELTKIYNNFVKEADDIGIPKVEAYWSQQAEGLRAVFK